MQSNASKVVGLAGTAGAAPLPPSMRVRPVFTVSQFAALTRAVCLCQDALFATARVHGLARELRAAMEELDSAGSAHEARVRQATVPVRPGDDQQFYRLVTPPAPRRD